MNETYWLTVDEAALLCREMGLSRTKKTVRDWARKKHVAATKQTTSHGEMWVLDKSELTAKIDAELEFAAQERTRADTFEPVRTGVNASEPVRTSANPSEPVHRDGVPSNVGKGEGRNEDLISSLETKIQTLSVDVGWREQALGDLKRENQRLLDNMHGQARYIGHLESDLIRLGGEPDQTFLAAPTVQNAATGDKEAALITKPHPDQQNLYTG